jgi:aconitate hydratase
MTLAAFAFGGATYRFVDLKAQLGARLARTPWIIRIVLENVTRHGDPAPLLAGDAEAEIEFRPSRLMMHDTTCGPALVDIAAARDALAEAGGDPRRLNPVLPVDVSTDHSLAADVWGSAGAAASNMAREMARNTERYRFMKWATAALDRFTVHPPGTGIMHTLNLERLATVAGVETRDGVLWARPDTLIGTDSHTPMVGGIGVLGWGVGGLEAEGVMFGMPVTLLPPEVVGVRLTGALKAGVTATDLALVVTERLRRIALGGRFVEFFGPGVSTLTAGQRAVVANMAPEYGAATGYFPVDEATLAYLRQTGRAERHVGFVEAYAKAAGLWFDPEAEPSYAEFVDLDLAEVGLSLAGPRRPQDRVSPSEAPRTLAGARRPVALAAITSCTNTSDPRLLIAAGLVARKARALDLKPPPWVKTTLAPGSPAARRILERAGLLDDLEALGFAIVGFGCTVCIGNSGPLAPDALALAAEGAEPVAVLSGNRNFPGRVHGEITDAFLASPPLVVAYAVAGEAGLDIAADPLGQDAAGRAVRLADLWPSEAEIEAAARAALDPADYAPAYAAAEANAAWAELEAPATPLYPWEARSTYLRRPPFARLDAETRLGRYLATPLMVLGDDVTTDHISPAGAIASESEAGRWLVEHGDPAGDLNVFSSRRGNWEAMLRGLFTNRNVRNLLAPGLAPGQTVHAPTGEALPLWRAAVRYAEAGEPLVIVAGERYGMGSSRDWAAKGQALLGVRAVLANGFERIHRANLINMGILPLRLPADVRPPALALTPNDRVEVDAPAEALTPRARIAVAIHRADGRVERFETLAEVETSLEAETLRAGGLLPMILRRNLV